MGADQTGYANIFIGIAELTHRTIRGVVAFYAGILGLIANRGSRAPGILRVGGLAAPEYVASLIAITECGVKAKLVVLDIDATMGERRTVARNTTGIGRTVYAEATGAGSIGRAIGLRHA